LCIGLFEIDGSQKSGSGTILRLSVALAAITGQPLHICNIRHNRPQPGLKPQHLEAVLTAAKLCKAQLEGATLGSRELWFKPQQITGGTFQAEIGTAGNIPMLLMTILPICIYAKTPVQLQVCKGGTDTIQAPTINYLQNILLPTLKKMNIDAQIIIKRYGYYPKGMGEVILTIQPTLNLKPINLQNFGNLAQVGGVSVCTFLANQKVAQRQAQTATETLTRKGYSAKIQIINDTSNPIQKGSSIVLWAKTDTGVILGADAIGELKKTSEAVGKEAAEKLFAELVTSPTVDVHLADMLIPFMALTREPSVYLVRVVSDHLETNIWLAEKMLDARFKIEKVGALYRVEKLAQ
jgi:RNA 3'-terminal phosphate cyclase (ATP)